MSANRALTAKRFFAAAIDDFGITEGDCVRIPMRQCELARQRNISASTVGAYLTAMGDAVVARRPEIIINSLAASAPTPTPPTTPANGGDDVLELVAEVLDVQARLIRAIVRAPRPTESVREPDPRENRESARDPRGIRADLEEVRK